MVAAERLVAVEVVEDMPNLILLPAKPPTMFMQAEQVVVLQVAVTAVVAGAVAVLAVFRLVHVAVKQAVPVVLAVVEVVVLVAFLLLVLALC